MRRALRRAIPSMFHRRLTLLICCAAVVVAVGLLATARLTVGAAHRSAIEAAEQRLKVATVVPTVRGRILDRRGRVLAFDQAGWDVAVHYSLIDGSWAREQAYRAARAEAGGGWSRLPAVQRERRIQTLAEVFDGQVAGLWHTLGELGGLGPQQVERRRAEIAGRVQNLKAYLVERWRQDLEEELEDEVPLSAVARPIAEERQYHAVLEDVGDEVRLRVQQRIAVALSGMPEAEQAAPWRQVRVKRPTRRRYPLETMTLLVDRSTLPPPLAEQVQQEITVGGVGTHVIGQVRPITAEDLARLDRPYRRRNRLGQAIYDLGGYSARWPEDRVGASGLEMAMERALRGSRGQQVTHLATGEEELATPPQHGHDVQSTLDIHLQARIQAIMAPEFGLMISQPWHGSKTAAAGDLGRPLAGAAVVMDVATCEVLAAVSVPSMPLDLLRSDPDAIFRDPEFLPWVNRATMRSYQPGSTLKPLVLLSAVTAGLHPLHAPINCAGIFDRKHPTRHRCWIFRQYMAQHGPLDAATSLEVSCNIYYYELGQRMGIGRLNDWFGRFGLGRPTGCGIEESAGDLPDPATTYRDEAINMGIGQGPVGWTPMQAATAYAAIARGGEYLPPTLIVDEHRPRPRSDRTLGVSREAIAAVIDGMYGVVHGSNGTGRYLPLPGRPEIFNVPGVVVMGKSGTAQTGRYRWIDFDLDGERDQEEMLPDPDPHAWFVALVQPDGADLPTHVIVVVSEYAGSGAKVSGPVVNQVIHALRTEGYLPS